MTFVTHTAAIQKVALKRSGLMVTQPLAVLTVLLVLILEAQGSLAWGQPATPETPQAAMAQNIELALEEVVALVAQNNRTLKNAYLQRKADGYLLKEAEDRFKPDFVVQSAARRSEDRNISDLSGTTAQTRQELTAGAELQMLLTTGAELNLGLTHNLSDEENDISQADLRRQEDHLINGQTLRFSVNQPLLRNAGTAINTAPVEIARQNDAISALSLQTQLNEVITASILAYRAIIKALRGLEIAKDTLAWAKEQHARIARLIVMGRVAQVDLIQAEAEIATSRLRLIQADNAFQAAQLELNKLLDADVDYRVLPRQEAQNLERVELDRQMALVTALSWRPDYLKLDLEQAIGEQNLLIASDARRFNLDLQLDYTKEFEDDSITGDLSADDTRSDENWRLGLVLSHTFGDLARDRRYHQARIALMQIENRARDLEAEIRIEVDNSLRNVALTHQALEVAQKARELSEEKLRAEMKKLEIGRSSTFAVTTFKNDVAQAKTDEVGAVIDYLNALTLHEQVLGVTWRRWQQAANSVERIVDMPLESP